MASLKLIDQRLQQNSLEMKVTRTLISGKAIPVSDTEVHVSLEDGTVIQKIVVEKGIRTPLMSNPIFSVYKGKVRFCISATLSIGEGGAKTWVKELAQEKELRYV